ncbi:macrolide 2'-phosphotransferase MphK [Bacillus subtilis]|uniref:macrolide 2'-phosphotransferase MphK n=1 Tax=Bacillus subtilis TaxID=1423 RepID=UPI00178CDD9F|nr:macrolide 2'-phosphotransferase MphK [Bacillus subtilis]QOJ82115.1 macrolide 2'-phosphotransferase MphK [Bacillus subtilis]WEY88864.1 macrolide 2'-phosphotransferase MphK [Bacillus subtilis]WEZ20305.1 macrolide 2'-phosphotransferase MphK [Bacillus subtilis]
MTNLNEIQLITEIVGLARSQGLTVHSENAQLNETGMDFQVVFAKDDTGMPWVLRKPRRSDVVERASAEGITLAFLRANLTADVPDWRIHTPELIAYPMLKGTPAAGIDLEQKQYVWNMNHQPPSDDFVRTLAGILAELHGTDQISAGQSGIEVIRPEDFRQMTADSMVDVKNKLGVSTTLWERWQKWVDDDAYWPGFSSLIHGDLHPPHILIDQNERVTGLLDWTEAKVADPAKDFVLYQTIFGEKETARLLEYYNQAGGRIWAKMQEHISEMQAAYPVEIAKLALQTQQEEHINMALEALGVTSD